MLSGIGFIGAGAIVRRGKLVEGVTTAATLWFVTVMGMCFGAGYLALGAVAFGLAAFVLLCLRWAERRVGIPRRARLVVSFDAGAEIEQRVLTALAHAGYKIASKTRASSPTTANAARYAISCVGTMMAAPPSPRFCR